MAPLFSKGGKKGAVFRESARFPPPMLLPLPRVAGETKRSLPTHSSGTAAAGAAAGTQARTGKGRGAHGPISTMFRSPPGPGAPPPSVGEPEPRAAAEKGRQVRGRE